jgi:endonuclease/exonuclease/phosphatase family metal-dependent hydrolase
MGQTTAPGEAESAKALRVMSFNIRNSNARDGANHWNHRQEFFISTIRAFDPDLLGLQEVLADQHDQIIEAFGDYQAVGVARDDGAREGEWSMILFRKSRFEQTDGGTFWLSDQPEKAGSRSWDAACVRICSWARLRDRATGREFLFANTHFDHESQLARLNSAHLLRERLPKLAKGAAVILAGDFNCGEDSEPYKALVGPGTPPPKVIQLFDSYRFVHPTRSQEEATFHGFKGTRAGSRIDWILHTAEFEPTSAEIVRTSNAGRYPSDHYAVTAVLQPK